MAFQLDLEGPYYNIRMRLGNVLIVCDLNGFFFILATFQSKRVKRS